jgi:hypothetical protein
VFLFPKLESARGIIMRGHIHCDAHWRLEHSFSIRPNRMVLRRWFARPSKGSGTGYSSPRRYHRKIIAEPTYANPWTRAYRGSALKPLIFFSFTTLIPQFRSKKLWGAMSELVDAGKVRFIGVSNFSLVQLQEAQTALTKHSIVSNQVRYNLIDRTIEKGLLQYCQANGITVIAYSPLARGLSRITDCDPDGAIPALARITGKSCAQIVLNWCLCKDRVAVIPGANSEQHVLENCGASDWRMTAEQVSQLDAKIQFRHRTGLDALLRRNMPRSLERTAVAI